MVSPISNDKISSQTTTKSTLTERGSASRERDSQVHTEPETVERTPGDDSLRLSSTSQVLEAAASRPPAGPSVETPEQARDLLARITSSFREAGAQALQAQGGRLEASQAGQLLQA